MLPGESLWIRAKDYSTGSISSLTDNSGAANHSVSLTGTAPTIVSGVTPSGGKAIDFPGNGYFTFPRAHALWDIVASTQFNSGQFAAVNVADGDAATVWASSATDVATLRMKRASGAFVATSYQLKPGPSRYDRYPKNWTFEGSNNGSSWTTLDTRTGVVVTTDATNNYSFSNSTAYIYYRLNVTAVRDSPGALVSLAEFDINTLGSAATVVDMWMVVKSNGNTFNPYRAGTSAADLRYPFGDGNWYDDFCGTTRVNFPTVVSTTSFRLIRAVQRNPTREWYIDNVSRGTNSGAWAASADFRFGHSETGFFIGQVAELYMRLIEATTTPHDDKGDLITYFNTEHGLSVPGASGNLPGTGTARAYWGILL